MLQRFPGRTLEELDGMDYGRFMRAVAAENMQNVEQRRRLHLDNSKAIKLTDEDWIAIERHDRMMADGA